MQTLNPFRVFSRPLNIPFFLIIVLTFFLPLLPFFLWKWEMDALGLNDLILIAWEPGQELLTTGTLNDMKIFDWDITVGLFTLLAFSFLTYFPMFLSLVMGQLSAFSLLVLALATYFFLHKRWTWLGIALGLSFIKPQVMPLLTGLLLLWALIQRRWQVWIGFGGTMAALVLISLPFISSPSQLIGGGISSHLSAFIKLTTTIWALFMNWGTTWHIPFVISILLLAWVGWLWLPFLLGRDISDNRARFLISIAVIVNLLVIPYSWIYNLAPSAPAVWVQFVSGLKNERMAKICLARRPFYHHAFVGFYDCKNFQV
jgi:hypothetical protein